MTNQEAFDRVCQHLAKQKERCIIAESCRYRLDNKKCAIGALIPDELYESNMDMRPGYGSPANLSVIRLITEYDSIRDLFQGVNANMLYSLQIAHDTSKDLNMLKKHLYNAANQYALDPAMVAIIESWK